MRENAKTFKYKDTIMQTKKDISQEQAVVKQIRAKIGMTQAKVAQALGISVRAIQSYEQGWREVPTHISLQLLVLAAAYRPASTERKACWKITGCLPERQQKCPCRCTDGRLCWLVSRRMCAGHSANGRNDLSACMSCPVVQQILS